MPNEMVPKTPDQAPILQLDGLQEGFSEAFRLVDDVVLKNYVTNLSEMRVIPLDTTGDQIKQDIGQIRLFQITEMVYEQDESATYKFASVFNAAAVTNSAIITVIDSDGRKTDFYMGIRLLSKNNSTQTAYSALVNAIKGQFPGIKTRNLISGEIEDLLGHLDANSISSVSCVANNKNAAFVRNEEYLQGLEKLALAMQGKKYSAVIIANPTSQEQLNQVRQSYESIYTHLSPYATSTVNVGTNKSETVTCGVTEGKTVSMNFGHSNTENKVQSESINTGEVVSETAPTRGAKTGRGVGATIGAATTIAGAVIGSIVPGPGTVAGAAAGATAGASVGTMIGVTAGSSMGNAFGSAISAATEKSVTRTHGGGSKSTSYGMSDTINQALTLSKSETKSYSYGVAVGDTQGMQLTIQNKPLISMLDRIDKQLECLSDCESVGMWECAAYFLSGDSSVSKVAAATYKALMSGEESGLEASAVNTWNQLQSSSPNTMSENDQIAEYIRNLMHPVFAYHAKSGIIPVTAASMVSSDELAIHMGLPRHSVCGFPVVDHASFGKEVIRYGGSHNENSLKLGSIFDMGRSVDSSKVTLDIDSLAMHTFITGATGSGKSNTIYTLLNNLTVTRPDMLTFMVIEPAKGEYKRVFGSKSNVSVFGTNPTYTPLLKINPFKFPKEIHVLEHIDRLIDIFNVCWPMYAAMPAVLKDAILSAYSACGWDLTSSRNSISDNLYPTFQDLLEQLVRVIDESAYADEVKSNYVGSLTTRVKSLTNGLNGQIFSSSEIDNRVLFDTNVIVDLSRVGSQETKALIMGILVMRLSESRMSCSDQSNSRLRHITVLEEAHNILAAHSQNMTSDEGGSISEKSVEMLSNAIAEMRTFGEGFIIADQSPGAVDASAIRNTNTKIIMRLPEETDRHIAGKSAALRDNQIDEIAKLPQGVAVVYQSDWIEPVLCQIDQFCGKEHPYKGPGKKEENRISLMASTVLIRFIVHDRLDDPERVSCELLFRAIEDCECSARTKASLYSLVQEYRASKTLHIWNGMQFGEQSHLVSDISGLSEAVEQARRVSSDFPGFMIQLNTLIAQKFEGISDDFLLTVDHCLIKEYSDSCEDGISFYRNWVDAINGRSNVL